jgi:hypothetical protein
LYDEFHEKVRTSTSPGPFQALSIQRTLTPKVDELFHRIDQDNRLAIPAVVNFEDDFDAEESDAPVQFVLPLSIVDPKLKGMFILARRRGSYYSAHRIVGREEAYSLARPIRKNVAEREWYNMF